MKKSIFFLMLLIALSLRLKAQELPRVFIFTDINIDVGDPDDRQSLIHLFWYADELKIEGIIPDHWFAQGYEACELVINAYAQDFDKLKEKGYPKPKYLKKRIARNKSHARKLFQEAASKSDSPLYVLIWGDMLLFEEFMKQNPSLAQNIRILTIGTGLMLEKNIKFVPKNWEKFPPCQQPNWNGHGRNEIYHNPQFNDMWWLEMNWTYEGMFEGEEPKEMFQKLSVYGALGKHMQEVVQTKPWALYFRVGDTPSVLYVIDPNHNLDDPRQSSWAGKFVKPFPQERANYYTDFQGNVDWNYADPCKTWKNHLQVLETAKHTLLEKRSEMYQALLHKLNKLYE